MALQRLTPMLWTDDLPATIAFYRDILGFEIDEYHADWGWCHMHKDEVALMYAKPNTHTGYQGSKFTGSFYCNADDVDELWEKLKHVATIGYAIANFSHGMREFAILDNNGYMFQFGREMREDERVTEPE